MPPVPRAWNPKLLTLGTALGVLVIDQASKAWVMAHLPYGQPVPVLDHWIRLVYIRNPNAVFGISLGQGPVYLLLTLAAIAVLLVLVFLERSRFLLFLYGLFLGGALGNLLDRIRWGEVVDFVDMGIGRYRWPGVYNLADAAISIGIVLYLLHTLRTVKKPQGEAS